MVEKTKSTFQIDKLTNFNDWYNEIIRLAELVDMRYNVKGFIVYRQWSTISIKKIFQTFEELLEMDNHSPTIFPVVIPESNFEIEKEHVAGFAPEVLWVETGGSDKLEERLALRPTSETAMYPLYSLWIRSYRDLPLKHYQSGPVFRYETKATRPFVRGREFWWIEAHDVFATRDNAVKQVQKDLEISRVVLGERLGIPLLQFQRPQWDKFAGADETYVSDAIMPNGRFLQLPSTHLLGQRFAKAFNIKFIDEENFEQIAYQTCYGPGITRIYGGMIATHGDNSGLILPYWLAPIQIVIVPILGKKSNPDQVLAKCNELVNKFKKVMIRVELDNSDSRPGDKYYFWEMKGVPFRLEVGQREVESNEFVVAVRDTKEKTKVQVDDLITFIHDEGERMIERLTTNAWNAVKDLLVQTSDLIVLKTIISEGKVGIIPYCSMDMDGKSCAEKLKTETEGGDVRGRLVDNPELDLFKITKKPKSTEKCLACGKKATIYVHIGKQY
jgi:prolyl-tRNA synthetase